MNKENIDVNNQNSNIESIDLEEMEDTSELEGLDDFKVLAMPSDPEISSLIKQLKKGRIYIPDYQRKFVWKRPKSSKLVESVLLGFPIPPIYLSQDPDGRRQVIDGQQRLVSLQMFYDGEFKLQLDKKNKWNKKLFNGLKEEDQEEFINRPLRVITLLKDSHPKVKYEMFERLNRGSVSLNDQEIRNCVYRGDYLDSIKRMAKYPDFVNAVNYNPFIIRMQLEDLITRFGALIHHNYELAYKGSAKIFLQKEMESHQNPDDDFIRDFENEFKKCANLAFSVFGKHAFKRYIISKDGNSAKWDTKPNKALFEAIMYGFAKYNKNQIMNHKDQIYEGLVMLMTLDEKFNDLISHHTNAKDRFLERMEIWNNELDKIVTTPRQPRCFSYKIKKDLYEKKDICNLCSQQIIDIKDAAVDHQEPYWRGGLTIPENAQLAHRWCNLKKSGKTKFFLIDHS